jgi:hypothetical protein
VDTCRDPQQPGLKAVTTRSGVLSRAKENKWSIDN